MAPNHGSEELETFIDEEAEREEQKLQQLLASLGMEE